MKLEAEQLFKMKIARFTITLLPENVQPDVCKL
jgi:hypothetical protein